MRLLLFICALVLCVDTYLEIQLLHRAHELAAVSNGDEQQEQQENNEPTSLSHDKTSTHIQHYLLLSPSVNTLFFTTSDHLTSSGYIRCLYQPPEV